MALILFWASWTVAALCVAGHVCAAFGRCQWYVALRDRADRELARVLRMLHHFSLQLPKVCEAFRHTRREVLRRLLLFVAHSSGRVEQALKQWSRSLSYRAPTLHADKPFFVAMREHKQKLRAQKDAVREEGEHM